MVSKKYILYFKYKTYRWSAVQVYTASNGSFWLWTQKIRKQPCYSGAALELSIKSHDHHQIMDFRGVPHWLGINLHEDQLLVTHRLKKKIEAAEVKISWIFSPSVSLNPRVPWSNLIASFMKPSLLGKHTHLSNSTSHDPDDITMIGLSVIAIVVILSGLSHKDIVFLQGKHKWPVNWLWCVKSLKCHASHDLYMIFFVVMFI